MCVYIYIYIYTHTHCVMIMIIVSGQESPSRSVLANSDLKIQTPGDKVMETLPQYSLSVEFEL